MTTDYQAFIARKLVRVPSTGLPSVPELGGYLFPFQKDLTAWALRRGRCAIFASTGLGKTRMLLEWARCVRDFTGRPVLVLAPLAVAGQTAREGEKIGIPIQVCRESYYVTDGINITNYDRLHKFDTSIFGSVVLDESSCVKHETSKRLAQMIESFSQTPFKLCATATPAPNDYSELGTHAEFLGVCTRQEMLAEFFIHDGSSTQDWRMKGHARQAFWRWVATWGAMLSRPGDLGYDSSGYDLPKLTVNHHVIKADAQMVKDAGLLFAEPARTLTERRNARRVSIGSRVEECANLTNAHGEQAIVWCDLNLESDELAKAISGVVEVRGSMSLEEKEGAIAAFISGSKRVLLSKSSICGFGLNLQFCNRMAFVGVTDSWEKYHQAVRRIWRFGQTRECTVDVFASEVEGSVVENLQRKERDAAKMAEELAIETREAVLAEIVGQSRMTNAYHSPEFAMPSWLEQEPA